jgi:hypothetical protein
MDRELLDYLRAMALELSALADEGNFASLSRIFGMAALDAAERLGPAIVVSQEADEPPRGQRRPRGRGNDELADPRGFRRGRKPSSHATT